MDVEVFDEAEAVAGDAIFQRRLLDQGFLRLVEAMGGDDAVVRAARVSYGKGLTDEAKDAKLIHFLMRNRHESPFEHAVFKFHVKCPIFVARQWFRHRWGSYNEISGRYTAFEDEAYVPPHFRTQVGKNYEYEDVPDDQNAALQKRLQAFYDDCFGLYKEFLEQGVAKEQARMVFPLSTYTQFYWTVNCRSLLNFINLRADIHAQQEIRVYAEAMAESLQVAMPVTFEAFKAYQWKGDSGVVEALGTKG